MNDSVICSDNPLTPDQTEALRRILAAMIPASIEYSLPGADDPLIFADVLATGRTSLPMFTASLQAMTEHPNRKATDRDHTDSEDEAVSWYRQQYPQLTAALVALTAQCYYRDDRVMASLNMEVRPPYPDGYELPDSDWSLLDPVRRRGRIYRDVSID